MFNIYFGCDHAHREQAVRLVEKEMSLLRHTRLSDTQLRAAKKQAVGQVSIANDHHENLFLALGKSFLRHNRYEMLPVLLQHIEAITADELLEVANEIFAPERLFSLMYE